MGLHFLENKNNNELYSLQEFLGIFKDKKRFKNFNDFYKIAKIKTKSGIFTLDEYAKKKRIKTEDLKNLFMEIQNSEEYLTRFYNTSLEIDLDKIHIKDIQPMRVGQFDNNKEVKCKNVIRNLHLKNILQDTKSGLDGLPSYLDVLEDLYVVGNIDYKIVTPSSLHYINKGRLGSVFSSYYFRASIMNPYLVYSLNKSLLKGTKIFTPTLGWTSYCYGFLEDMAVNEYVGIDVIPDVCKKTRIFAKAHSPEKKVEIYCNPSESFLKNKRFMDLYKNHFDVVFFSPPYYKLEMYEGVNQSTNQYKTYEEWLEKYWEATIRLCHHVLMKGGRLCYILSGYGSDNTDKYDLLGDMNGITKKYFSLKQTQPMYNKNVHSTSHKETNEQILLFIKT
jgi:hypothetical protein